MDEIERMVLNNTVDNECITRIAEFLNYLFRSNYSEKEITNITNVIFLYIDKLLNTNYYRYRGITILNDFIFKFPPALVLQKSSDWLPIICTSLTQTTSAQVLLLEKLVKLHSDNGHFNTFMSQYIPKIICICVSRHNNETVTEQQLKCITTCMKCYPRDCMTVWDVIEEHLSLFISSMYADQVVRSAGTAFHTLQGIMFSNLCDVKCNWRNHLNRCCASMHEVFDEFLHSNDFERTAINYINPFDNVYLLNYGSQNRGKQYHRFNQLRNLTIFISCMLTEPFVANKEIDLPIFLDLLQRGLTANIYAEESEKAAQMIDLLRALQIELLYLLSALFINFGRQLIPFNWTILKILLACQEACQKYNFVNDCNYKRSLYSTIFHWVVVSTHTGNESIYNKMVTLMIRELGNDASHSTSPLALSSMQRTTSIQQLYPSQLTRYCTESYSEIQEEMYSFILICVRLMLNRIDVVLDENNFYDLFDILTKNLEAVHNGNSQYQFNNLKCAHNLYKILALMFKQENHRAPSIYTIATTLLEKGQRLTNETDPSLALMATECLQVIRSIHQGIEDRQ